MPVTIGSLYIQFPKSQPQWLQNLKRMARRYRIGVAFARGKLSRREAFDMMIELERVTGVYTLESLDAENVLETAREYYEDDGSLEELVHDACDYVARKWDADTSYAHEHATDFIEEMAHRNGVTLTRRNPAVVKRYG